MSGTADPAEVRKFGALAARWWDPAGPMRPLHAMNPLRIGWIAERLRRRGGLQGLRVLDVGCGAGLASEALARLGCRVTGVDASAEAIEAARTHAAAGGLSIAYRIGGAEDLAEEGAHFDAVVALEVVEHVTDREAFCASLAAVARPGAPVFLSTLNRTARSFLLAKVGAEYLLRMLPVGTHDWRMFPTPGELGSALRRGGLPVADIAGMAMHPLTGQWRESRDVSVNYIVMAERR